MTSVHAALDAMEVAPVEVERPAPAVGRRPLGGKLIAGLIILGFFALVAAFAPVLARYDPNRQDILNRLANPSTEHWLGTDGNGRDVWSRLIYSARVDLPLGLLLALFPCILGTLVGLLAGYYGRWVDTGVMRTADLVQAFPTYIFIIALVTALGPGAPSIILAFLLLAWVTYARIVRADVLRIREQDFIHAAKAGGIPDRNILFRHVLPNTLSQVIVYLPADVLIAIVALASLSFLGVGIQPPTAEWGSMITDGQPYITTQWWLVTVPGLTLALLGAGLMLIADGIDDRIRDR